MKLLIHSYIGYLFRGSFWGGSFGGSFWGSFWGIFWGDLLGNLFKDILGDLFRGSFDPIPIDQSNPIRLAPTVLL